MVSYLLLARIASFIPPACASPALANTTQAPIGPRISRGRPQPIRPRQRQKPWRTGTQSLQDSSARKNGRSFLQAAPRQLASATPRYGRFALRRVGMSKQSAQPKTATQYWRQPEEQPPVPRSV